MVADRGINFLVLSGWPKSSRFSVVRHSGTGAAVRRRRPVAAHRQDRFNYRIDVPKLHSWTFDGMACLPSSWLLWAVRWRRRAQSEATQGALVRDFSRTSSTSSTSTIIISKAVIFAASEGAWQPRELELSDPLAQPSLDHVLTWALSYPHRSLHRRRHRSRPLRLDNQRPWASCCGRYRRYRPLHRPRRRPNRGALLQCTCTCATHVHAPYCSLTPTNPL